MSFLRVVQHFLSRRDRDTGEVFMYVWTLIETSDPKSFPQSPNFGVRYSRWHDYRLPSPAPPHAGAAC